MGGFGVWIALGGLALTFFTSVITVAFLMGRVFERQASHSRRLTKLEEAERSETAGATALTLAVGRLESASGRLEKDMEDMRNRFGWMGRVAATGQQLPP